MDGLDLNVSRETLEKLQLYQQELIKWSASINLVAKSTYDQAWQRHIIDSAQLFQHWHHKDSRWADFGSGGGLPGIVLAIIGKEQAPDTKFHLLESDQRKSAFLRKMTTSFALNCQVISQRIEVTPPICADAITARAFAPLPKLIELAMPHLNSNGRLVLLKGRSASQEIEEAKQSWDFDVETFPSLTDSEAKILEIKNIVSKK